MHSNIYDSHRLHFVSTKVLMENLDGSMLPYQQRGDHDEIRPVVVERLGHAI
jgi:hypothetical protein